MTHSPQNDPDALPDGTFVSYTERGRTRYGQVVLHSDGTFALSPILGEDIAPGTMVHPAKWSTKGYGMLLKAGRKARAFTPPPKWRSDIPCSNREGQPAVLLPQCDGSENAEILYRSTPLSGSQPSREDEFISLMTRAFGADLAGVADTGTQEALPVVDPISMQELDKELRRVLDVREAYLCRNCSRSLFPGAGGESGRGRLLEKNRTGTFISLRPD